MKTLIAALALTLSSTAFAQHGGHRWHHGHHHRHWHPHLGWVVPAVVGGAVVYAITRPETTVVQNPPVIVQNPPIVVQQKENCTPWTETQHADGTITRTRTCHQ